MKIMNKEERYTGSIVGLAVGDALGTTIEFQPPGSFMTIKEIVGGGPFRLPKGYWTDDTTMALCTLLSLLEYRRCNVVDQARRYWRWVEEGYMSSTGVLFDIGETTSEALCRFKKTGDPYSGLSDEKRAGNGSIMRIAPVALAYSDSLEDAVRLCAANSAITHRMPTAIVACKYMASFIYRCIQGDSKNEVLTPLIDISNPLISEIVVNRSYAKKNPPQIKGTGYVVDSLEAALWAFYTTDTFEDGMIKAVNLGDDADTTGAVYGQLAGAYYGHSAIPKRWTRDLHKHNYIYDLAQSLCNTKMNPTPDPQLDNNPGS